MECNVCCCAYNYIQKPIECSFCGYTACTICQQKYLLDLNKEPECMSCRHDWSSDFVHSSLGKKFFDTEYKEHRKKILIDRETSLLPDTQQYAELVLADRKIKEQIKKLEEETLVYTSRKIDHPAHNRFLLYASLKEKRITEQELDRLQIEYREICVEIKNNQEYKALKKQITDLRRKLSSYTQLRFGQQVADQQVADQQEQVTGKKAFVRPCPAEGCRGFLSSRWNCGLCEVKVCSKCHAIKEEDHVCNADDVLSAEAIKKDSKNCPKCGALIFRISGCSQMFCTHCKTSFDWVSGRIITRGFHNPHYHEYIFSQRGQQPNPTQFENICDREVPFDVLLAKFRSLNFNGDNLGMFYRSVLDAHDRSRHTFSSREGDYNRDIRTNYLLGDYDEKKFKFMLYKREKEENKKREFREIIEMTYNVFMDISRRILRAENREELVEIYKEYEKLYSYVNDVLNKIKKKYDTKINVRLNFRM